MKPSKTCAVALQQCGLCTDQPTDTLARAIAAETQCDALTDLATAMLFHTSITEPWCAGTRTAWEDIMGKSDLPPTHQIAARCRAIMSSQDARAIEAERAVGQ